MTVIKMHGGYLGFGRNMANDEPPLSMTMSRSQPQWFVVRRSTFVILLPHSSINPSIHSSIPSALRLDTHSQPPTKYLLKYFYTPFKVVQNTLVPVRRLMTQDGKFVQEIIINTAVYSAKIDPEVFQHLQEQ